MCIMDPPRVLIETATMNIVKQKFKQPAGGNMTGWNTHM